MTTELRRPNPSEHAPYFSRYIDLVPDGDIVDTLMYQLGETLRLLQEVPPERETHRYAPGKWSIREVVGHLIDTERVFAFRAIAIARSDGVDLPSMEQDEWAAHSNAHERALDELASEWASLRRANVEMLASLAPEAAGRRGRAGGNEVTVRSLPWMIAGHELWHRERLAEDYLGRAG
ncbi:MAG: DinB family protein [Gemmatimonadetes bacterium]|nr:DinB family protein [Gemmatimonadota bacterium]